jgi:hypothetical protein
MTETERDTMSSEGAGDMEAFRSITLTDHIEEKIGKMVQLDDLTPYQGPVWDKQPEGRSRGAMGEEE